MPPRLSLLNKLILILFVAHNDILHRVGFWKRRVSTNLSSSSRLPITIVCEAFVVAVVQPRCVGGFPSSGTYEDPSALVARSSVAASLRNGFLSGGGGGSAEDVPEGNVQPMADETVQRIAMNRAYISTLEDNLHKVLDEWILNGNRVLVSIALTLVRYLSSPSISIVHCIPFFFTNLITDNSKQELKIFID